MDTVALETVGDGQDELLLAATDSAGTGSLGLCAAADLDGEMALGGLETVEDGQDVLLLAATECLFIAMFNQLSFID